MICFVCKKAEVEIPTERTCRPCYEAYKVQQAQYDAEEAARWAKNPDAKYQNITNRK